MYKLIHPELMSELELKEILENRCIDFSNYNNLSRFELIELYKQVALPLPQRQSGITQNSDTKKYNQAKPFINKSHRISVSSNGTSSIKASLNETIKPAESSCSVNEVKQTYKKLRLHNSNSIIKYNEVDKHIIDEKNNGAPSKKRQKITWP